MPLTYCLGIRTVAINMRSHNNYKWPLVGIAKCPDFKGNNECGNGLHFLKDMEGDYSLTELHNLFGSYIQILKIPNKVHGRPNVYEIDEGEKYKCRQCEVLYTTDKLNAAINFLERLKWQTSNQEVLDYIDTCVGNLTSKKLKEVDSTRPMETIKDKSIVEPGANTVVFAYRSKDQYSAYTKRFIANYSFKVLAVDLDNVKPNEFLTVNKLDKIQRVSRYGGVIKIES